MTMKALHHAAMPDEQRLRQFADEFYQHLWSERLGRQWTGPGNDREVAIEAMINFLRESGLTVERPQRVLGESGPTDRFSIKDRAIRLIGDQLRQGKTPHPGSVWGALGLPSEEWRSVESGLVEDDLIAYANSARSEFRLRPNGEARYREITASRRRKALNFAGTRLGMLSWAALLALVSALIGALVKSQFP